MFDAGEPGQAAGVKSSSAGSKNITNQFLFPLLSCAEKQWKSVEKGS